MDTSGKVPASAEMGAAYAAAHRVCSTTDRRVYAAAQQKNERGEVR